jgi:hypothetical protein
MCRIKMGKAFRKCKVLLRSTTSLIEHSLASGSSGHHGAVTRWFSTTTRGEKLLAFISQLTPVSVKLSRIMKSRLVLSIDKVVWDTIQVNSPRSL